MAARRARTLKVLGVLTGLLVFCWCVDGLSLLGRGLFVQVLTGCGLVAAPVLAWVVSKWVTHWLRLEIAERRGVLDR